MMRRVMRGALRFSKMQQPSSNPNQPPSNTNQSSSNTNQLPSNINHPSTILTNQVETLLHNGWRIPDPSHKRSQITHLSNAEQLIHKVPVIFVQTNIVRCMGGTELNAGHPQVYIQLNVKDPKKILSCKYCGLRYQMIHHDVDHDMHNSWEPQPQGSLDSK